MSDIKVTCLSIDCPERTGGECNAYKNPEIAQVQFLIESNAIEDVRDVDSLKQAQYAWDYLMKQDTLSADVVLKTHKILMLHQKLHPDQKGYFRKEQVWIGNREGMHWKEVPSRVWAWTLETMRKYPPVDDRALHVLYERIHPFIDGNGRTGRMFMNWTRLKRLNLPLLVIKESEKYEYYKWFD